MPTVPRATRGCDFGVCCAHRTPTLPSTEWYDLANETFELSLLRHWCQRICIQSLTVAVPTQATSFGQSPCCAYDPSARPSLVMIRGSVVRGLYCTTAAAATSIATEWVGRQLCCASLHHRSFVLNFLVADEDAASKVAQCFSLSLGQQAFQNRCGCVEHRRMFLSGGCEREFGMRASGLARLR